jgi:hypothetical protein
MLECLNAWMKKGGMDRRKANTQLDGYSVMSGVKKKKGWAREDALL